ncbi:dUTPase-like protein [Rhodotorula diobovata]|uniref:Deoxyuridine 5'-triphosphate nucleotidohydrolase n=1 Tax=Rhodotorula diobovata TaxID=5288 RepID=A0A5C5FTH9_9BASI|nr:dUTPase-like protein [Rhodotorula diobovata]
MKRPSPPPTDQPHSPALKRTTLDPSPSSSSPTTSSSTMSFLVQRLVDSAKLPARGSALAAGYDLAAAEAKVVPAQGKALISTGLAIAVPEGTYGRIAPRSGLASKHMIDTGAGVIDADYRGEVKVLLFNHAKEDFQVNAGDRVAQLILERIVTPEPQEVASLADTVRGAGGFGSTGGFGAATASAAKAVVSDEVAREVEAVAAREKEAAAASA